MSRREQASRAKAVLMRARSLIADPTHWTRGRKRAWLPGHRLGGRRMSETNPDEFAYCALGAIEQATNRFGNDPVLDRDEEGASLARAALKSVVGGRIVNFNDTRARDHTDVLAAFDKAIEQQAKIARGTQ